MLSVAHLCPYPRRGAGGEITGVPGLLHRLLPALSEAGVGRQVVIAAREETNGAEERSPAEIRRSYRSGLRFRRAGRLAAEAGVDVLHAQHEVFLFGGPISSVQFPQALRSARRRGVPVVATVHGVVDLAAIDAEFCRSNGSRVPPRVLRSLLRHLIGSAATAADRVVVHEEVFRERLIDQFGVRGAPIDVIALPVPIAEATSREEARRSLRLDGPTALFFGFVTGYKGLPALLDAWGVYRGRGGRGTLIVAGGRHPRLKGRPDYERTYRGLQDQAAGIGGVRWDGYLPDEQVPRYMTGCDALVLPYHHALAASGPMSFALAYGLPVVATDALRDHVPVPELAVPADPGSLADALKAALDDGDRDQLASASREMADDRSLARIAGRLVEVYASLR